MNKATYALSFCLAVSACVQPRAGETPLSATVPEVPGSVVSLVPDAAASEQRNELNDAHTVLCDIEADGSSQRRPDLFEIARASLDCWTEGAADSSGDGAETYACREDFWSAVSGLHLVERTQSAQATP